MVEVNISISSAVRFFALSRANTKIHQNKFFLSKLKGLIRYQTDPEPASYFTYYIWMDLSNPEQSIKGQFLSSIGKVKRLGKHLILDG